MAILDDFSNWTVLNPDGVLPSGWSQDYVPPPTPAPSSGFDWSSINPFPWLKQNAQPLSLLLGAGSSGLGAWQALNNMALNRDYANAIRGQFQAQRDIAGPPQDYLKTTVYPQSKTIADTLGSPAAMNARAALYMTGLNQTLKDNLGPLLRAPQAAAGIQGIADPNSGVYINAMSNALAPWTVQNARFAYGQSSSDLMNKINALGMPINASATTAGALAPATNTLGQYPYTYQQMYGNPTAFQTSLASYAMNDAYTKALQDLVHSQETGGTGVYKMNLSTPPAQSSGDGYMPPPSIYPWGQPSQGPWA